MNPLDLMQLSGRPSIFAKQHPRVVAFFKENGKELREGTIIELKMKTPEGKEMITNLRLTADDVETIGIIKGML